MDANGFNLSYDQIINLVHKEGKDFSVSIEKFKADTKNFNDLRSLSSWNPIKFNLANPATQSNALSACFG